MKFLILDPNEDFYPIYERKLEGYEGLKLIFCSAETNVKEIYTSFNPDCILINHSLSKASNIYNYIRELGFTGDVVILSPGKEKRIKRNYYNGIAGVVDKFLNKEDFQLKLREILKPKNVNIAVGTTIRV